MLYCCLKCRKITESKITKITTTNKGKLIILSKCAAHNNEKLIFIKNQKTSGLLSNLGLKTPLRKIPLLGDILL